MAIKYNFRDPDAATMTLPPAMANGFGKMVVSLAYDDDSTLNRSLTASHAYYQGKITIDSTTVFEFNDIGVPIIKGRAVDNSAALKEAMHAAVTFGSAFEGSGHGDVSNTNERAYEFSPIWDMARMHIDDAELKHTIKRPPRTLGLN